MSRLSRRIASLVDGNSASPSVDTSLSCSDEVSLPFCSLRGWRTKSKAFAELQPDPLGVKRPGLGGFWRETGEAKTPGDAGVKVMAGLCIAFACVFDGGVDDGASR